MAYRCRFLVCVSEDGVCFLNPGSSVLTHSSCPWGARPASDSCSHLLTCCGQLQPCSVVLSSTRSQAYASAPALWAHGLPSGIALQLCAPMDSRQA